MKKLFRHLGYYVYQALSNGPPIRLVFDRNAQNAAGKTAVKKKVRPVPPSPQEFLTLQREQLQKNISALSRSISEYSKKNIPDPSPLDFVNEISADISSIISSLKTEAVVGIRDASDPEIEETGLEYMDVKEPRLFQGIDINSGLDDLMCDFVAILDSLIKLSNDHNIFSFKKQPLFKTYFDNLRENKITNLLFVVKDFIRALFEKFPGNEIRSLEQQIDPKSYMQSIFDSDNPFSTVVSLHREVKTKVKKQKRKRGNVHSLERARQRKKAS